MADPTQVHPTFRLPPHIHVGDPAVLLDNILAHANPAQSNHVIGLYLDSVATTLEANLKFVNGIRSVMSST